ncbi:Fur-regulated basic protein FbpA [Litchfieldia alkalitelluris]|uniref:Fur-regulated basic protein FbpA n=1 Tax=Litchfieldia alkalitelluris TaxID=304268 RepID=UPI000997A668|nr:Fur-regulated basic protein FbpA [Litchfieldia alkalitelluris]
MTKFLRSAVEKTKNHYLKKLVESGAYSDNEERQLAKLTLSELIEEYKKSQLKPTR